MSSFPKYREHMVLTKKKKKSKNSAFNKNLKF